MKFTINTEDFSSKFVVFDSEGLERYQVKNEMDSVMRKLTIFDLADNIVCTVEKKFFTLRPTYVIFNKHQQQVIHIRKKLNLLHPQFTITSELDEVKFHTTGDYFGSTFSITCKDDEEVIAKITRNSGYIIDIINEDHDASALIAIIKMSLSEEAIKFGRDHVQGLFESLCRIPIRPTTPINFYYKTANNLIDEADYYYKHQQFEQSFILYSRYITLFVEGLKLHHPSYATVSINEREHVKEIIRSKAFPRAEELKGKLREKYAQEYEMKQKSSQEEDSAKLSTVVMNKPPTSYHDENEFALQQLKDYAQIPPANVALFTIPPTDSGLKQNMQGPMKPAYDRTQKPAVNSTSTSLTTFRRIAVPHDITSKFLQVAQRNTDRKIETCGILAGSKKDNNHYIITHIVVPKQNGGPDSCDTEKEEEMVEYVSNNDLITLGWIHTHPTQTVFLSSVDLHTHLPYQMLMQEAIAIVISPKYNETAIFSLTQETGIPVLSTCKKTGFHEHINNPPLYLPAAHTMYDPGLQCAIVDLRT